LRNARILEARILEARILKARILERNCIGEEHLSIGNGGFWGEKCWLRFTIKIVLSQTPYFINI